MYLKMTNQLEIYNCEVCGNIVEILRAGVGQLVCCNAPMVLMKEQTADWKTEKHVPVVEKTTSGVDTKVGSVPHPMEENHFIEWIEVIADGRAHRKFLNPGEDPAASFELKDKVTKVREYCNIHGLWSTS